MRVTIDIPDGILERLKQASAPDDSIDQTVTYAAMHWLSDEAGSQAAREARRKQLEAEQPGTRGWSLAVRRLRWSHEIRRLHKEKVSATFDALWDEARKERPDWFPF